jgi:hypothetical protein
MSHNHIARGVFIPGSSVQRKDSSVRNQKLPRTFVQNKFLNSEADLLILVKCVENYREIRKMQTQFCWIPGEKHYNFCKAYP